MAKKQKGAAALAAAAATEVKVLPHAPPSATDPRGATLTPLSVLRFGHDAPDIVGGFNARKKDRLRINGLAQSLSEFGLILPLVTRQVDGEPYVLAGNRRLAALRMMVPQDQWEQYMVRTVMVDAPGAHVPRRALELSMVENVEREGLHPVDRFEVFKELVDGGATVEEIGHRYVLTPRQVRQALSLASMAPAVRDAWRDGKIDAASAEAFAEVGEDHEQQERVLAKLAKSPHVQAWQVAEALGTRNADVGKLLKVVGQEAYEAAGHHVNETLFSRINEGAGQPTVSSRAALVQMAQDRVDAECKRLTDDGWSWAKSEMPNDAHAWKRVHGNGGKFTKEEKALAGCFVRIDYNGNLEIHRGFVRPGDAKKLPRGASTTAPADKKKRAEAAQRKEESGGISNALAMRVSRSMTLAVGKVIDADPDVALPALIAAIAADDGPLKVQVRGLGEQERRLKEETDRDFGKYFKLLAGKPVGQQLEVLATWASRAVDMLCHSGESLAMEAKEAAPMLDALGEELVKHMRSEFDAKDFFASVGRDVCEAALKEMGLKADAKMKKPQVAEMAAHAAAERGWLPEPMRTRHYKPMVKAGAVDTTAPAKGRKAAKPKAKAPAKRKPSKGKPLGRAKGRG